MFQSESDRRETGADVDDTLGRRRSDFRHGQGPILDPGVILANIWRLRRVVVATTVIGALIGVLLALSTPQEYYAEARLYIDPRDMRASDTDNDSQLLPTDAMLAMVDSQVQILQSPRVLRATIDELDLLADPEFNGTLDQGGLSVLLGGAGAFLSAKESEPNVSIVLDNLRDRLTVSRDASTFVINVGMETRDAEKSARIANGIVENYLDNEAMARSGILERTSSALSSRIDDLRRDLDRAERAVEEYKAENGIIGASGEIIGENRLLAFSERLTQAQTAKVELQSRVRSIESVNVDDVVTGAMPEAVASETMTRLRGNYATLRAEIGSLTTQLGPRHPRLQSLRSSLETIRQSIRDELQRLVATARTELERATRTERELGERLATLKRQQLATNVDAVQLRELEREAAAMRQVYEDFLLRARRASEQQNISIGNVRVIADAVAPLRPSGTSRKLIAVAGTSTGFLVGLGIAFLAGAFESLTGHRPTLGLTASAMIADAPRAKRPERGMGGPMWRFGQPGPDRSARETEAARTSAAEADDNARDVARTRSETSPAIAESRVVTPRSGQGSETVRAVDEMSDEELEKLRQRMRRLRERADAYARMAR